MDIELRRYRSTLRIVGTGVIAFAVWAALKPFLILLMVPTGTVDSTLFQELPLSDKIIAVLMILLLEALVIGFRLYLGFSARAEGLGKRKGKVYVVLAFVYFFIQLSVTILTVGYLIKRGGSAQKRGICPNLRPGGNFSDSRDQFNSHNRRNGFYGCKS